MEYSMCSFPLTGKDNLLNSLVLQQIFPCADVAIRVMGITVSKKLFHLFDLSYTWLLANCITDLSCVFPGVMILFFTFYFFTLFFRKDL